MDRLSFSAPKGFRFFWNLFLFNNSSNLLVSPMHSPTTMSSPTPMSSPTTIGDLRIQSTPKPIKKKSTP